MGTEAMSPEQARAVLAEAEYTQARGTRHYPDEQRAIVKAALSRLERERAENAAAEAARQQREQLARLVKASTSTTAKAKPAKGQE
jgi:hypothetical protein